MKHVFSIKTSSYQTTRRDNSQDVEPPILVAANNTPTGAGFSSMNNVGGGAVDVINDFYWTYSKLKESRQEVPRIILNEKRLKANALISQLKYSFGVTKNNVTGLINKLPTNISNPINNWVKKSTDAIKESGPGQAVTDWYNNQPYLQDNNDVYTNNPYLLPYQNLYITEPTGWQFILPYFDNRNNSQANAFANDMGGSTGLSFLKQGVDLVTDLAEITSVLRSPTQVTFVERAKFYNYPTEGEDFSFEFPLINTGSATFEDVIRNWELLFLLLYNNKPSRKNVSVIDPPPLYQVEIPGVKFLPFCYISAIGVDFKGSRRELSFGLSYTDGLNVESSSPLTNALENIAPIAGFSLNTSNRNITTIVPDAYTVRITIKSLIPESRNFMYSVLNKNNIITTNAGAGVNNILNPFINSATQNSNAPAQNPLDTTNPRPGLPVGP